ncbi:MAG TPA: response regulator transcription factor [Caulobacteraceae bacterium]|jgi:two-component system OmpR family response regulator
MPLPAPASATRLNAGPGPQRILVVDHDPGARHAASTLLARHGYQVETAGDAWAMEAILDRFTIDAIVLEVRLPGEDGLSVCRRLARPGGPAIIMLSAVSDLTDRVVGLELGADDYLPKPYNPRELLARVRAVLRRSRGVSPAADQRLTPQSVGWRLDLRKCELCSPRGAVVSLSRSEFMLLQTFVERPRQVLSGKQLWTLAHGPTRHANGRSIVVQISRLRRKLCDGYGGREFIRTQRSQGYVFAAQVRIVDRSQVFFAPLAVADGARSTGARRAGRRQTAAEAASPGQTLRLAEPSPPNR